MVRIDEHSVVVADDDENIRVGLERGLRAEGYDKIKTVADTGELTRYVLSEAYRTSDEDKWNGPLPPDGRIIHHHMVDLNMPEGNLPGEFRQRLAGLRQQFPSLEHKFSSMFAAIYLREKTGYDLFFGTLTGELDSELVHPELVRALQLARFQYRHPKDRGFRHPARVLRRIERPAAEEIGIGNDIVGAGASGKSNIARLANSQQRGLPETFNLNHAEFEIYGGMYTHHKLTDNEYPENERHDLRKLHHDSFYVKKLGELAPHWRKLHAQGDIVYYESMRAEPHHHLWVMTKKGERLVSDALKTIEPDFYFKKNTFSAESMSKFKDWTVITTNIEAGLKILEYGSRFTTMLPVRVRISDHALMERNAYRGGLRGDAHNAVTSPAFIRGTREQRESIIRGIDPSDADERLVDDHGNLTDFAQRMKISLDQNQKIERGFNPPGTFVFDADNMISEMYRLHETNLAIRRECLENDGRLRTPLDEIIKEVKKELESEI